MEQGDRVKLLRYRWFVFATLAFAYLFVYFHRLSLSVVAEELAREFDTSAGALGFLGSVYFYCYAFMQFPAGLLSDSIGPRKAVSVFTVVAAVGSFLFGMAPHLEAAFAGRFLVGIGAAMVFIPTMKILAQWFHPKEFAFVSGILNAVGGLGILGATWLLAWLTTVLGWRISFQLIGAITFGISVLVWAVVRDRPEAKGWEPLNPAASSSRNGAIGQNLHRGVLQVVASPQFWLFALWSFFNYGVFFGFGALWSGPYLMHVYGMSREQTGVVLSLIAWGMIFGSPALGFLSDKVFRSRKKLLVACAFAMTLELGFLRLFPAGLSTLTLMAFFLLFSVSSSSTVVIAYTAVKELFPIEIAGTALGSLNLFPFLGGAVAMPLLGRILDSYAGAASTSAAIGYPLEGYTTLLSTLFFSALVVLACTFFMRETYGS